LGDPSHAHHVVIVGAGFGVRQAAKEPIDLTAAFERARAEPAPTHVDEFNKAAKAPIRSDSRV